MSMVKGSAGSLEAETLREQIGDRAFLRTLFAFVENNGSRSEFVYDLPAGPARRTWDPVIVHYSHGLDFQFGAIFGHSRKDRGTLGAVCHSVGRIFNVASHERLAFRGENRRANSKVREGRIGILHHFAR